MSQFIFNGNVCAVNQQVGDRNEMTIYEQDIEVNWVGLCQEIEKLEKECSDKKDRELLKKLSLTLAERKPQKIREFIKNNVKEFSKGVLSGLTSSAIWEVIKILL